MFTGSPLSATCPAIPVPHATLTSSLNSISSIVLRGHTSKSFDTKHLEEKNDKNRILNIKDFKLEQRIIDLLDFENVEK